MMSIIYLETSNIEWGQIDPSGNRRVKATNPSLPPGPLSGLHLGDAGRRGPADPPRHPHHPLGQHAQQGGAAADHPGGGAVAARGLHHHDHGRRRHGGHHGAAHRQRRALRRIR